MRRRVLSLLCAIAVVATMLSAATLLISAESQKAKGTVIDISSYTTADWTATNATDVKFSSGALTFTAANNKDDLLLTYNTAYDFSEGFTVSMTTKGAASENYYTDLLYFGGFVGNVKFGMMVDILDDATDKAKKTRVIYPAIMIDDTVVAKGAAEATLTDNTANVDNETASRLMKLYGYNNIFSSKAVYNPLTKVITFARYDSVGSKISSVSYTDTGDTVSVADAQAGIVFNCSYKNGETYKAFTVDGVKEETTSSEATSSEDTSSAEEEVGGPKLRTEIMGKLIASDWVESDLINTEGALVTDPDDAVKTITYVTKYNLGKEWTASYVVNCYTSNNNAFAQPMALTVGDVYVALNNSTFDMDKGTLTKDAYLNLKVKGVEKGTYSLPGYGTHKEATNALAGNVTVEYKDGKITVSLNNTPYITYDASADALDFSETEIKLSAQGGFDKDKPNKIVSFGLKSADTNVVVGEKLVKYEGIIKEEDWEGSTSAITESASGDTIFLATKKDTVTIWTKKYYNLDACENGFEYKSYLMMHNGYNNFWGVYNSMYIGQVGQGIELRIQNKNGVGEYNGYIYVGDTCLASVDLINAPNGTYDIKVVKGKISVALNDTAITWTLPNGGTATSVELPKVDLSNAQFGLTATGNYNPTKTYWKDVLFAPLSSGGKPVNGDGTVDDTGDKRNLVVPIAVMVTSVCALAFVFARKKSHN